MIYRSSSCPVSLHTGFYGDIIETSSAPVTEIATIYLDGRPPGNYFEGAEKSLKAWEK